MSITLRDRSPPGNRWATLELSRGRVASAPGSRAFLAGDDQVERLVGARTVRPERGDRDDVLVRRVGRGVAEAGVRAGAGDRDGRLAGAAVEAEVDAVDAGAGRLGDGLGVARRLRAGRRDGRVHLDAVDGGLRGGGEVDRLQAAVGDLVAVDRLRGDLRSADAVRRDLAAPDRAVADLALADGVRRGLGLADRVRADLTLADTVARQRRGRVAGAAESDEEGDHRNHVREAESLTDS